MWSKALCQASKGSVVFDVSGTLSHCGDLHLAVSCGFSVFLSHSQEMSHGYLSVLKEL